MEIEKQTTLNEDSVTCDDNDEMEHLINSIFSTDRNLMKEENPNSIQFEGKQYEINKKKLEFKKNYVPIGNYFSFSLIDCLVNDKYIANKIKWDETNLQINFNIIRKLLNSHYYSLSFVSKSIINDDKLRSIQIPYFICFSNKPMYSYLSSFHCLFNSSSQQIQIPPNMEQIFSQ